MRLRTALVGRPIEHQVEQDRIIRLGFETRGSWIRWLRAIPFRPRRARKHVVNAEGRCGAAFRASAWAL